MCWRAGCVIQDSLTRFPDLIHERLLVLLLLGEPMTPETTWTLIGVGATIQTDPGPARR